MASNKLHMHNIIVFQDDEGEDTLSSDASQVKRYKILFIYFFLFIYLLFFVCVFI